MPRVNKVMAARKAIPSAGVEVGDTYYWWKFRYGGKRVSKTYPSRSELTQAKIGMAYDAFDSLPDELNDAIHSRDLSGVESWLDSYVGVLEDIKSEYEEAAEAFDGGGPNQEYADAYESAVDEAGSVSLSEYSSQMEELHARYEEAEASEDSDAMAEVDDEVTALVADMESELNDLDPDTIIQM